MPRGTMPAVLAGLVVGTAVCGAWTYTLATIIAAAVAYGVARAVSERTS